MQLDSAARFVGREHELAALQAAWARVPTGGPQVCVLRGESGFGKTRLVQAFYAWLSEQTAGGSPGYWPRQLHREANNLCLNPPPAEFGQGLDLPWVWWGVRWPDPGHHNLSELSRCALIDSLHHLAPHRTSLEARAQRGRHAQKVALEALSPAADAITFGTFGMGKSLFELVGIWREERAGQQREGSSVEDRQEAALQAQIDSLHDYFRAVLAGEPPLPMVLVLDDAHWIDARSLAFVGRLLAAAHVGRWPLMLIATHWEQDWNLQARDAQGTSFAGLYNQVAQRFERAEPPGGHAVLLDVDRLQGLAAVLRADLPGLTEPQVAWICERADGNPRLLAEIVLELRDEPGYFEQGDVQRALTPQALEALGGLSFELHNVQRRRFRRLDHRLRQLLGYASYLGMRFLRTLVLDVARRLDASHGDDAQFAQAVQPYALLLEDGAVVYEFRHRVFHDLALERLKQVPLQGPSIGQALLGAARDWLNQGRLAPLTEAERETFLVLMLAQGEAAAQAFPGLRLRLLSGLFHLHQRTGHYGKLRDYVDALVAALPPEGRVSTGLLSLDEQSTLISMLMLLDQRAVARRLAEGLLQGCLALVDQTPAAPHEWADLSVAETLLGDVLEGSDLPHEALALYEQALHHHQRASQQQGDTHASLRAEQHLLLRLGTVCEQCDRRGQAKVWYQRALAMAERQHHLGGDTAESLRDVASIRHRLANLLVRIDQPQKARELHAAGLAGSERILAEFGETPERLRDLMTSRGHLGDVLQAQDEPEQAQAQYLQVLQAAERLVERFGATAQRLHDLAAAQTRLGMLQLKRGALHEARGPLEQALETHRGVVAEYGETALRLRSIAAVRGMLGLLLPQLGEVDAARIHLEAALASHLVMSARFGETAERLRDQAIARSALADLLYGAGGHEPALALYEQALATLSNVLAGHGATSQRLRDVGTLQLRIGALHRQAGRPEPAHDMLNSALAMAERLIAEFGATELHLLDACAARAHLGDLAMHEADGPGATQAYQAALAGLEQLLAVHGDTADRRTEMARLHDLLGDLHVAVLEPSQAQTHYLAHLAHRERVVETFGPTLERLRHVGLAHLKLGVFAKLVGDLPGARQSIGESEQRFERLALDHPSDIHEAQLAHVRALLSAL